MSTLDLQEQEQVDAIKAWWKDNAKWVLGAISVALFGYAGMQFWNNYQAKQAEDAGRLYVDVVKQTASGDAKRVNDAVTALVDKFGGSAYAPRAQLLAVQINLQNQEVARAKTQLQWVVDHAKENGLQEVARLKLAGLLLDEKSPDAAMKLLESGHAQAFAGLYADVKGDILVAQGKNGEARAAYRLALEKLEAKSPYRSLVELKLDGLGDAQ